MKCPLSNYILEKDDADNELLVTDCIKDDCAWWNSEVAMCCIKGCLLDLATIAECLGGIEHKMPERRRT